MAQKDPEKYLLGDDGLTVEKVGSWAIDKIKLLTDYVQICGATRKKYLGTGAAYIDPFCGPGRSIIRGTNLYIDGSAVAAFKQANASSATFTSVIISDADEQLLEVARKRLTALGAPVTTCVGPASSSISKMVQNLNPDGLHLAFLDPYSLGALSFDLFEELAKLKRVDIIAHVSVSDLQRNATRYADENYEQIDKFAPGWRGRVSTNMSKLAFRAAILKFWSEKVTALGFPQARHCELIQGDGGQRLYWLILLAGHDLPHNFWKKVSSAAKAPKFDF